jgi:polyhydroxyalkanoate synthesis regulator phasin
MPPKRRKGRKSTEIPEGVSDGLWDMLLSIEGNTAQTSDRVDELEEKVVDLEGKQNTEELVKQGNTL